MIFEKITGRRFVPAEGVFQIAKRFLTAALCAALLLALCSCNIFFDAADPAFIGGKSDPTADPTFDPAIDQSGDPGVVGTRYAADGFSYIIPVSWRGHIAVDIRNTEIGGLAVVERIFYYVDDGGVRAKVLQLYETASGGFEQLSISGSVIVCMAADGREFINVPFDIEYPDGFTAAGELLTVYEALGAQDFVFDPTP